MMLKRKSTRWAGLKLLLFAPLAVVLLQAFARPEITGAEELLSTSEVTTIFQQSQQTTKDFDEKIDAYLEKFNGNTSESREWTTMRVDLTDEKWFLTYYPPQPQRVNSNIPTWRVTLSGYTKTNEGKIATLDKMVTYLKDREKERCGKNLHSPSIVYLTAEDVSDPDVQFILDALRSLNEEFTKAREEQIQKAKNSSVKSTFTEMYSDIPVYVAINERIKHFPAPKQVQTMEKQKSAVITDTLQDIQSKHKIEGICDSIIVKGLPESAKNSLSKAQLRFIDLEKMLPKERFSSDSILPSQLAKEQEKVLEEIISELQKKANELNLEEYFKRIEDFKRIEELLTQVENIQKEN